MDAIPLGTDLSSIPLAPNPNGNPPNFVNPPSQADALLGVGLLFIILSTLIVSLRLLTSYSTARRWGLDDYLCLFAQISMTALAILGMSSGNTARHVYDVPLSFIDESYVKRQFASNFVVGPALWSSKAAILALYVRLFRPRVWLRYTSYATLLVTFLFYSANIPLSGVFCTARPGQRWDFAILQKCSTTAIMAPIQGAVGLAADLVLFGLPLPVIYSLNLPPQKKFGLVVMFLLGLFAIIASSVSLFYRVKVFTTADKFWLGASNNICVFVEGYTTIIISCAPAMSSFWVNIFSKSAFYSRLRTGFYSLSGPWTSQKDGSFAKSQKQLPHSGSPADNAVDSHGYYELRDMRYSSPSKPTITSDHQPFDRQGIIQKSTTISQFSEEAA